ncbi:MAG TPA: GtrA family protein [Methanomicrobia archaeon]|nr:GtrA family protein [Methanomicrobia archaeon]
MRRSERLVALESDAIRLFKFSIVGGIGAVINTGLLWLFTDLAGIFYLYSSAIAIEIAIIMQFLMNDRWTFKEQRTTRVAQFLKRIIKSNIWRSGGLAVNIGVLYALTEYAGLYYLLSNIVGILCAFLLNYLFESRLTWGVH